VHVHAIPFGTCSHSYVYRAHFSESAVNSPEVGARNSASTDLCMHGIFDLRVNKKTFAKDPISKSNTQGVMTWGRYGKSGSGLFHSEMTSENNK
jgi:hypothetical protein